MYPNRTKAHLAASGIKISEKRKVCAVSCQLVLLSPASPPSSPIFKIYRVPMLASPIRAIRSGLNSYPSEDLAVKKCVPCDLKGLRPMSEQAANELLPQVEGWSLVNEDGIMKLHRAWKVKTFSKGLEFFQLVADVAEREGHHPDLHLVGWNNVDIEIWTHSVGGLTENDFILAVKINSLNMEHLLRKKASAE